jgi:hypothetical protein
MNAKTIMKILRYAIYAISLALIAMIGISVMVLESTKKPPEQRNRIMKDMQNQFKTVNNLPKPWPPMMNKTYPIFSLIDQEGKPFKISDYQGKVIIVENIDMSMPESQSLSGARTLGPFGGEAFKFDPNLQTINEIIGRYSEGKVVLPNPDIVVMKVIYYNQKGDQAMPADAASWAQHFKLNKAENVIVAVPEKDMRGSATASTLTGYQLIDRTFNLRVDASGPKPKHNLEMTLIPLIPKLL